MKRTTQALGLMVAAGVAACGGGLLAVLQIVTPLGGAWTSVVNGKATTIQFTGLDQATQVFLTKFDVTADVISADGVCGADAFTAAKLVGTVDNGTVVLRRTGANSDVCIRGNFADLRKLDTEALGNVAARSYINDQVDVQLPIGLWVSESGALKLKFKEPSVVFSFQPGNEANVTGCDVSNPNTLISFSGQMKGFDNATLRRPIIDALKNNLQTLFTQVEYVDGSTLRLINLQGGLVTLKRQPSSFTCPP